MRFGKFLISVMDSSLRDKYVPYRELKKVIKSCEGSGCAEASTCGNSAMAAVCTERFCLELHDAALRMDEFIVLQLGMMQEEAEISRLAIFAEVNATAITKIIKKFEKKIGDMPELHQLMADFCRLPGLLMLASTGFSRGIEILLASGFCLGCSPNRECADAGQQTKASSQVVGVELADARTSLSSEDPAPATAAGGMSQNDFMPDIENQLPARHSAPAVEAAASAAAARPHWLPSAWRSEVALLVSASLCFAASLFLREDVAKGICGLVGVIISTILFMLVVAELVTTSDPRPARFRTCVWALSSFGELLAGGRAVLAVREICIAGTGGESARATAPDPRACQAKALLHEPRVELGTCACCMDDFSHATEVAVPPCGHIFCEPCLRSWAAADRGNGGQCPVCRTSFELEEV
mmetsp:Transcript_11918/g.29977  ORF Transcript_11918/g.29977 Transcript_11918/m.29977 type:complete len:412 (-) Transcript_11918:71-1306(-)